MATVKEVQQTLANLGLYTGKIDDEWGEMTTQAVIAFQRINAMPPNGKISTKLLDLLFGQEVDDRQQSPPAKSGVLLSGDTDRRWPSSNPESLAEYYGEPGMDQERISLPYSMRLAWDLNTAINTFACHRLVADRMTHIFREALAHYGLEKIRDLRLDRFGGCLNIREIRGGNFLSTHAWGIAVDLDPANNQLRWGRGKAAFSKPEYEPFWEIVESTGAVSLGRKKNYDWMHFQFATL
jgi:hypothetical protein